MRKRVEIIKVLVGPAMTSQPFLLPRRQLEFYSPYLRSRIEYLTLSNTLCLPFEDPSAFEMLTSWMNYEPNPAGCHQGARELQDKLRSEEKDGVALAFKVWLLTHKLGGPCLVLRDECIRYLYEAYTMPRPGAKQLSITPSVALYVFQKSVSTNELQHFIVAVLARAKRPWSSAITGLTWEGVLEQVPELSKLMEKAWGKSWDERNARLLQMEMYMGTPGEVTPDWPHRQTAQCGPANMQDGLWMRKDLREHTND
jgi:hypothetical protein